MFRDQTKNKRRENENNYAFFFPRVRTSSCPESFRIPNGDVEGGSAAPSGDVKVTPKAH